MTIRSSIVTAACALLAASVPSPLPAQATAVDLDTVRAGRFDLGRMWTFEHAPGPYFSETYGFAADSAWFARARLAALRIPGCSASFVSPNGLIITNHHCARGGVTAVSRPGESLLDSGFVARSVDEERRVPSMWADQLLAAEEVSDEVFAAQDRAAGDAEREPARRAAIAAVQTRLRQRYAAPGDSIWVQVVSLYGGGRYSAYVFRRFTDLRLVVAPEVLVAFFGGDPDNFTYPRYDLDFTILRVYGADGQPVRSPDYFRWGATGVHEGDVVFVIGNPGATSRLTTMAQLDVHRELLSPTQSWFLTSRLRAMEDYRQASLAEAEAANIRNRMFGLANSLKVVNGQLAALYDPVITARRRDAERQLLDSIRARRDLQGRYGRLIERLADVQRQKLQLRTPYAAFSQLPSGAAGSAVLRRAWYHSRLAGASSESTAFYQAALRAVSDNPPGLEQRLLALQLADVAAAYGAGDRLTRAVLSGRSPEDVAAEVVGATPLIRAAGAANPPPADDPAMRLVAALAPTMQAFQRDWERLSAAERELVADLGRARYAVYGSAVPPDGSGSPRIADGVVRGYEFNGTEAPCFTTIYGLYDRFVAHGPGSDWDLPYRWRRPPTGLDLGTPLNFVSTADTYGGNSGSPAVTKHLTLVGLNFDRNVEGLVRGYIFLPERGRNVMVDVRAVQAALDQVYDADRIVRELLTGRLFRTEQEADATTGR